MPYYPLHKDLLDQVTSDKYKGNFALWFNKCVPLLSANERSDDKKLKVTNEKGEENKAHEYYKLVYDKIKTSTNLTTLLEKRHVSQMNYCETMRRVGCKVLVFCAELTSPLITGIGQPHPSEVGMVFDHTLGIPYIPASSVKGISRFARNIELLNSPNLQANLEHDKDGEYYFDDEEEWTQNTMIFGSQNKRGEVVFLDAYPLNVPDMHVDIMNPHYVKYYQEGASEAPADNAEPKPIKFLTVKFGTKFVFRVIISKKSSVNETDVKNMFINALTREGVGAKTAVGYGLFNKDIIMKEPDELDKVVAKMQEDHLKKKEEKIKRDNEEKLATMSEIDKECYRVSITKNPQDIDLAYAKIDTFQGEDKVKLARAIKSAYKSIPGKWGKNKDLSPKQKDKKLTINSILGEDD